VLAGHLNVIVLVADDVPLTLDVTCVALSIELITALAPTPVPLIFMPTANCDVSVRPSIIRVPLCVVPVCAAVIAIDFSADADRRPGAHAIIEADLIAALADRPEQ
jgi:hypothetical protein